MREFKVRQGLSEKFEITRENFEEQPRGIKGYNVKGKDRVSRHFGICPACDNPIQLIGLYKELKNTDHPYGKHYNRSVKHVAIHNQQNYVLCPYASHTRNVTKDMRKEKLTDYEKRIYDTVKEYFDLAIYLLQEDTGIYISQSFAREMLEYYIAGSGYMYYWASVYNIPWMLMYFMAARPLYGRLVRKGSPLYEHLGKRKEVKLEESGLEGYNIVKSSGGYLNLRFEMLFHERTVVDERVKESIALYIAPLRRSAEEPIQKEKEHWIRINIDENRFLHFIRKAKYRNHNLLKIASGMM